MGDHEGVERAGARVAEGKPVPEYAQCGSDVLASAPAGSHQRKGLFTMPTPEEASYDAVFWTAISGVVYGTIPGPLGHTTTSGALVDAGSVRQAAGPIGQAANQPKVGEVEKKWDENKRRTTPKPVGEGVTLAALKASLDAKTPGHEWGKGGGELGVAPISVSAGEKTFTVTLVGTFVNIVPEWKAADQQKATATAKAEWERFIERLKNHEEGHVEIALKAFEALAKELIGKPISEVNSTCINAINDLKQAQVDFDAPSETDHGMKKGHKYGDALLDASIT